MMPAWFTLKLAGYVLAGLAAVAALWWLYSAITANPKAEARLSRNQAEAAAESGADAVNTVGEAGEREAAGDALTRENNQEIRNAPGADAPVSAEAGAAGLAALCRRRAYRDEPRCVRLRERGTDTR
jgi:hypothetical protein